MDLNTLHLNNANPHTIEISENFVYYASFNDLDQEWLKNLYDLHFSQLDKLEIC